MYVGVATMGLPKRFISMDTLGISQRTSQRLNQMIIIELLGPDPIEVFVATPPAGSVASGTQFPSD